MRKLSWVLAVLVLLGGVALDAQVLARPGWAGSGVTVDAWWRRGVFYRIDVPTFQDSNGDGVGDIDGITERLPYLQQLGVDAVILSQPRQGAALAPEDVGTFVRKAAEQHVRVLVELTSTDPAAARAWLNQGIAGLFVDLRSQSMHGASSSSVIRELRRVVDSFPGGRVLVANGIVPSPDGAQLSVSGSFGNAQAGVAFLRDRLQAALDVGTPTGAPLLELSGLRSSAENDWVAEHALATMVMGSRAAVILDAGRELGLRAPEGQSVAMQWTPSNVTKAPVEAPPPKVKKPAPADPNVYGAFVPYVAPKPAPVVKPVDPNVPVAVDPDTLPGFSTVEAKASAALNAKTTNAASEDADPASLLNFYRHLIALHHDNGSIRNGTETIFDRDAVGALLWVRRAPAGSRTAASVVVAANLSDRPVYLSLGSELEELGMRGGTLRALLMARDGEKPGDVVPLQSTDKLSLQPHSVFLGEIYHAGAEDAAPVRRSGRRHRRR